MSRIGLPDMRHKVIHMFGILLIGYERLDFLQKNIEVVEKLQTANFSVFISVDGSKFSAGTNDGFVQERDLLLRRSESFGSKVFLHNQNMGCDKHIPWAISRVLEDCDQIIVIEDDVRISSHGLLEMARVLSKNPASDNPVIVLGMSSLFSPLGFIHCNFWRTSRFFSAWGYGLNRAFWKIHELSNDEVSGKQVWHNFFEGSSYWKRLSKSKRALWVERFQRGNYDYRIQATMFRFNLRAVAPIFRIVDNVGHGLAGATHTRFKAPIYLRFTVSEKYLYFFRRIWSNLVLNRVLDFLDSNSWAGQGALTSRGRTLGIRGKLLKRFKQYK